VIGGFRSFDRTVQLLLINQLAINVGFYMLMPYLAQHLTGQLGLAVSVAGLILGVRNLTQQGMFLVGGSIADRFGYKGPIVAGCALRSVGFGLLGVVDSVPALVVASAATGFAGALFNPAVRAYLAEQSGRRRVEAFALFNVFYQAGILIGPLVGLLLASGGFRTTCLGAAAVFAALTSLQLRALPERRGGTGPTAQAPPWSSWRTVFANRPFILFAAGMAGGYLLSFQVYLLLPLAARRLMPTPTASTIAVAALFVVSGLLTVTGQVRLTAWCKARWSPSRCIVTGLTLMAASFLPTAAVLLTTNRPTPLIGMSGLLTTAIGLTLGSMLTYPFEMDTIVTLARNRFVASHYGLYNTVAGVVIAIGNLLVGVVDDLGHRSGVPASPWLVLALIGAATSATVAALTRRGVLRPRAQSGSARPAPRRGPIAKSR
jgi:MFS family permease